MAGEAPRGRAAGTHRAKSRGAASTPEGAQRRRNLLLQLVTGSGEQTVRALAEASGVTPMTIYRDVAALEARGLVLLRRGTVQAVASNLAEAGVGPRTDQHVAEKRAMARAAAPLIPHGSSVVVDDSTSALYLLRALGASRALRVVTNSFAVADAVGGWGQGSLTFLGGEAEPWSRATSGPTTVYEIAQLHVDFCALSASGVMRDSLYHPYARVAEIKRAMIDAARTPILLLDHSKFSRSSMHRFAAFGDFAVVVTDAGTPQATVRRLGELVDRVLVAPLG